MPGQFLGKVDHIAPDLRLLARSVLDVQPHPQNARLHGKRDVTVIAESLKRFGQQTPIVVQASTSYIIKGNGTFAAALSLGWQTVAMSFVDMDDREAEDYALVDNRSAELSQWDFEALSNALKRAKAEGTDLAVIGWDDKEAYPLLNAKYTPPEVDDAASFSVTKMRAISVTEEQYKIFEQAQNAVRTREGNADIAEGRCLELICADFLSGV